MAEVAAGEAPQDRSVPAGTRLVRGLAWTLIAFGVVVLLYLVYSLYFTNFQTSATQDRLRESWQQQLAGGASEVPTEAPAPTASAPAATSTDTPAPSSTVPDDPVVGTPAPAPPGGDAVALMWFERPGGDPPVTTEEYVVVAGTTRTDLAQGPGHYTQTSAPGADGNFAVAGHRTTYGAPFFHLEELQEGDRIHVMDPEGDEYVYRFVRQQVVAPTRLSVLDADPLGTGRPTITLTTCHPRFSNRQRLIAFGELVS